MSLKRMLPYMLLLSTVAFAAADKNFGVSPSLYKEGVLMQPIANMAIYKQESMILSETPMVPLRANSMYLRHKNAPKEYLWFSGPVDAENFEKLHAFSLADNYLKPAEAMTLRFYASQKAKAFQDESDIYFDREYIYSSRLPKLYFKKNGQWQVLQETDRPGVISFESSVKNLKVKSLNLAIKDVPEKIYPVSSGVYAFSFEAPGYLPYVDAVSVNGNSVVVKPEMLPVEYTGKVEAVTSVTLGALDSAKSLEDVEKLYDTLLADAKKFAPAVDVNEFLKIYPEIRKPLQLGIAADDSIYAKYEKAYNQKRNRARMIWTIAGMEPVGKIYKAVIEKIDSLQTQPLQVSLVPSKVEAIYEESCTPNEKDRKCSVASVRLTFGKDKDRYDVSWSGNAKGYTPDSLYALLSSGASVRTFIDLESNKPVKISGGARHQYRYTKFQLSVNNKALECKGSFELPNYIFDQEEVQEWLNVSVEETYHKLTEPEAKAVKAVKAEDGISFNVETAVPRVVRDKIRGNVAVLDSGSFRYKGKVVSMSGFGIHTTEVTQQHFKEVMATLDSANRIEDRSTFKGPRIPVHNINWNDAQAFCKAIGGDLPTEAQWEFAGRADNNEGFLWNLDENPDPTAYAIFRNNSYDLGKKNSAYGPQPVSSKKSNAWGIFDMSGNVAEWTRDSYFMFSVWVEKSNPTGAMFGSAKVYKGGSWKDKESLLNLTDRDDEDPRYWSDWIGFRCAFPKAMFEGK